jgi:hypothetical protein
MSSSVGVMTLAEGVWPLIFGAGLVGLEPDLHGCVGVAYRVLNERGIASRLQR